MNLKKPQRQRNRKKADPHALPPPSIANVVSVTASGASQVTVVFDQPVLISGTSLPATWVFGTSNRSITALVSATSTSYVFTVSGTVASSQVYSIAGMDPAARTAMGGYVAAKSGTLV
jgi:uncharacterized membrane protein YfcA